MKYLQHVLVGVDFSDCSANALREAARIAAWNDARLTAIHILEHDVHDQMQTHLRFEELEVLDRVRTRLIAFTADIIGSKNKCHCEVELGHPFDRLLAAAHDHPDALLVLGTEGLTQNKRDTGVIAAKCVRKVPLPVLLIPEHQDKPFRKIVACIDFSENSRRALEQAVHIAVQDRAVLELLHVLRPASEMIADMAAFSEVIPVYASPAGNLVESARADLEQTLDPFRDELAGIDTSCHVMEHPGVSAAIAERLKETHADLVVLGTRGRTTLATLLLGTTAEKLLHLAHCAALTVKPEGFTGPKAI